MGRGSLRWDAKRDSNQKDIVSALETIGCSVLLLHRVGDNCPDILVGYRGCNFLMEIKTEKGALTEGQKEFRELWRGSTFVVRSPEEAIAAVTRG